ncbi:response regulator [Dictyobacter aurantiacus]|uniref:DNA-binding response regulator n=1 Tax=Dictyobacter aurantiacus TaxID=1936993 RepID=A0A401ZDI6_9CHLR|nr:response regulator transcription factor [Dictyobacter aurantiacus]GCE04951.1 DNA-binding response regulator [Dictyobacter aurantiacus]
MHYPDTDDHHLHTTVATESLTLSPTLLTDNEKQRLATGVADSRNITAGQPTTQVRVLIVDDHALIREGLSQLFSLEDDIEVVGDAVDGFSALEKIRQVHPDVVLMDINLPVVDGIAITRQVTQQFPDVAVIMLTMHRQNQQIVEAMRNGARGYILKSATAREVAQAIRTVHAGGVAISPSLTGVLVNELRRQPEAITTPTGQHVAQLSEKEVEIIRYLAAGMSNKEIAERLAYSEKTVKNYLSIIFQKLHLRDRTQVAIFALRQGLLPDEEG